MRVHVDADGPVPPFEQIRAQLAAMIGGGALPAGHRLPAIRQLAADLNVAPGTVARSYRALEAANLVITDGRRGTHVAAPDGAVADEAGAHLDAAARMFATTVHQLGVDPQAAMRAIRRALEPPRRAV